MDQTEARRRLVAMARHNLDPARFRLECERIFHRLPLVLAPAEQAFELLGTVVREEDYATGLRQQRALASDPGRDVLFGRNEGGGQRFHRWVDHLLALDEAALASAFPGAIG
jgi:hypothetical protein